ncbi:MAG: endonuclease/exonuclease/phosphatase family protein, partial [Syntrophales bacterium]|nr:endonuclease/exonuclease/phosphatase family protein [Syntrophales bacterium]
EHVKRKKNVYGTAILSTLPLTMPVSIKFSPAPPTFSKGAVISTVQFPGNSGVDIDIVSVHLDFARKSVRQRQAEELFDRLKERNRPLILMGDFNCEWVSKEQTLKSLSRMLNVKAYHPYAINLATYPASGRRLDWILISPELEFLSYRIFNDKMSDHLGVISEIGLAK